LACPLCAKSVLMRRSKRRSSFDHFVGAQHQAGRTTA
jgi:hypothetical protein